MLHTHGHPVIKYDIDPGQKGTCLMARHRDHSNQFVVKIKHKDVVGDTRETCIWEEISFLRKLDHKNVIKLHETFEDPKNVFLVLEHCGAGALFDCLISHAGKITEPQARSMARHMQTGVTYLHSEGVCHRDIQPCNVLLANQANLEKVTLKLIDFSTAKDFSPEVSMTTKICTPSYVAPEILGHDVEYTEKVDVWSTGVVIYILLSGMPPFPGNTDVDVLKKVRKAHLKWRPEERWTKISDEAKDLMKKMMCKKVEDRISAQACGEHPWLA